MKLKSRVLEYCLGRGSAIRGYGLDLNMLIGSGASVVYKYLPFPNRS